MIWINLNWFSCVLSIELFELSGLFPRPYFSFLKHISLSFIKNSSCQRNYENNQTVLSSKVSCDCKWNRVVYLCVSIWTGSGSRGSVSPVDPSRANFSTSQSEFSKLTLILVDTCCLLNPVREFMKLLRIRQILLAYISKILLLLKKVYDFGKNRKMFTSLQPTFLLIKKKRCKEKENLSRFFFRKNCSWHTFFRIF